MKKRLCSISLASITMILFLIVISSTASASITETRLSIYDVMSNPDIDGDKIIWQDFNNGKIYTHIFDLSTKKETLVTLNGRDPSISGNKIIYMNDGGFDNVYVYDLTTKKETRVNSYPNYASNPAIYGNIIVWEDQRNYIDYEDWYRYPGDIYIYDISSKKETKIATERLSPSIYDNKIVWDNYMEGKSDVFVYDLSTKKETQITASGTAVKPSIYGSKIVWEDWRNGNSDIYMFDLSTKKETQITTNKSDQQDPVIYGNTIVWADNRNGNWDIYAYDLVTHQQIFTPEKSDQFEPSIYGNKVVWVDSNTYAKDEYNNGITVTSVFSGTISYLPVAAFSASTTSGKSPLTVTFTEKSTDAYYWTWNFGDGTSSTEKNPLHTYNKAGKYTVNLTVKNAAGSNTATASNYISVETPLNTPNADFSASTTSGNAPLTVKFTDKSTGSPTAWKWSFGDGSALVTQYNPTYTYTKPGTYTVKETVSNDAGKDTEIKTNYITVKVAPVKPVTSFTASPVSGKAPLKVQFTDKSTNSPTSWKWSFGDGTYSTSKNPSHTYTKVGKYTVTLTSTNKAGSNAKTMSGYIVVKK